MKKVSIIVPVYNTKNYLEQCLKSIISQTYPHLDIVVVDDGSTDGSSDMCDLWQEYDSRIRVFHTDNAGLSAARNFGINKSTADFISFVDSDDFIDQNFIESMLEASLKHNVKIAECKMVRFCGDTIHNNKIFAKKESTVLSFIDFPLSKGISGFFCSSVCNKLFHKSLFNEIKFPVGKIYEDAIIYLDLMLAAKKICMVSLNGYFYRQRSGSILNSGDISREKIYVEILNDRIHKLLELDYHTLASFFKNEKYNSLLSIYCKSLRLKTDREIVSSLIKEIRNYYKEIRFVNLRTPKDKLKSFIFNLSPRLYYLIYKISQRKVHL